MKPAHTFVPEMCKVDSWGASLTGKQSIIIRGAICTEIDVSRQFDSAHLRYKEILFWRFCNPLLDCLRVMGKLGYVPIF